MQNRQRVTSLQPAALLVSCHTWKPVQSGAVWNIMPCVTWRTVCWGLTSLWPLLLTPQRSANHCEMGGYFGCESSQKRHSENNSNSLLDVCILSGSTHSHIRKHSHLTMPAMLINMSSVYRRDNDSLSSGKSLWLEILKTVRVESKQISLTLFLSL